MSMLTLAQAKEILSKHTTEQHLFVHSAAVSAAMGAMAEHFGEDKAYWEAIGYLHDVDFEKFPQEHCHHVRELLTNEPVDEEDMENIILMAMVFVLRKYSHPAICKNPCLRWMS